MPEFESAVVFGKFWPLHVGHLKLLQSAVDSSHRVLVVVDDGSEDVPVAIRSSWVAESFPTVEVATAPDLCGHDSVHCTPTCSKRYAQWLRDNANHHLDAVYSGEPYGDLLAAELGAVSVRVHRSNTAGRNIRGDVIKHWGQLSPPARAWYCRRVVVVGAESTGTTTLASDLAERLRTVWVPEYGRQFTEQHGLDHLWASRDFEEVARRQLEMEDAAARASGPVLVCDTDVLATAIWHQRYLGERSRELEELAASRIPHLYILTSDDIPFVQDGFRDGEHIRSWMTGEFRRALAGTHVPWIEVSGSRPERIEKSITAVERHLGSRYVGHEQHL